MHWPRSSRLRASLLLTGVASIVVLTAAHGLRQSIQEPWYGYGGNPQHTSVSKVASTGLGTLKWKVAIDAFPQSAGSAHYCSPSITAANTVITGMKTGESDGFKILARSGVNGASLYTETTDYSIPSTSNTFWNCVYPLGLVDGCVVGAGGGGTLLINNNADADAKSVKWSRLCFYQPVATYNANPSAYAGIKVNTPIMGSPSAICCFGYSVLDGTPPAAISAKLGTGGVVKMNLDGACSYRRAADLVPSNPGDTVFPAFNAEPATSADGSSIYVPIVNASQGAYYLVKLSLANLTEQAHVRITDAANGADVWICPCSSASPMVATDGQVFFGTLRNNDGSSHGWMYQFDKNLAQNDATGKPFPIGAFGWDDTPALVLAKSVKSYKGTSPYLILTKYNNYRGTGGDGRNRLAILDPKNNDVTTDRITGIPTMNEVITVLGVTCDSDFYACTAKTDVTDPSVPVREWCINAAAVDNINRRAIVNSEDGHAYIWDFDTNSLQQGIKLQPSTGEPYTSTAIGPDGTAYVINKAYLHALAAPAAKP